jgi:hypothetical protein
VISRDLDGYTLCHRPKNIEPEALIEHYKRLCRSLTSLTNTVKHYWTKLPKSNAPNYKTTILVSAREIISMKHALHNPERKFIAGRDSIEDWDAHQMAKLGIPPQRIVPLTDEAASEARQEGRKRTRKLVQLRARNEQ